MNHTLSDLAAFLQQQGMPCQVVGQAGHCVSGVATLEEAGPQEVSFLANPKYEKMLATTQAGAVVVRTGQQPPRPMNLLQVKDPYAAITQLIVKLHGFRRHTPMGVSKMASVSPSARIGRNASIWPFATVADNVVLGDDVTIYPGCFIADGCTLGNNVVLMPNVVLYEQVVLGDRVTIHAGTVIGEDGLGFAPVGQKWEKIPQVGTVQIGDDVEIGSNCSIDRATLGRTIIARGTKFSNLIAIGHGCRIGENCLLVAQVGVAGSVTVGNHVTMAGQVGVVGHISVGDNATLAAKAGVTHDVPPGETYLGAPAASIKQKKREFASLTKLPEMRQRIRKLEAMIERLQREVDDLKARQNPG
jgi:UDP-3-O-[3-hydroxymyristoyl] glucosamine N-acyltransferase